ncbi:hypothetical protein VPNG_09947 [Cytospora leucostoma]|uniref:GH64 domain-containing protein n=1 Tax=Cytospora leucostoma TaxID=1230097 RepID=A0A423VL41_9PEZI|nr:hypothetical protein VPNG_09947 [Cytospora leucostoma]
MQSSWMSTVAIIAAFSLLYSARPFSFEAPYPTSNIRAKTPSPFGRYHEPRRGSYQLTEEEPDAQIQVTVQNKRINAIYTYVTGVDTTSGNYLMLHKEGEGDFRWAVKPPGNETNNADAYYFTVFDNKYEMRIQAKSNGSFYIPTYAASGRIYIADGTLRFGTNEGGSKAGFVTPSSSNIALPEYNRTWQFIEFSWRMGELWINISNKDLVSIPLGLAVTSKMAGSSTKTVPGLVSNATALVCEELRKQSSKDGYNWKDLCIWDLDGKLIRVISPDQFLSMHTTDPLNNYYDDYVEAVWGRYNKINLTIQTHDDHRQVTNVSEPDKGNGTTPETYVSCQVGNDQILNCYNPTSGRSCNFLKPTTKEIFGCSQDDGTFKVDVVPDYAEVLMRAEIIPHLCSGFQRSTLLRSGGDLQPYVNGTNTADDYYCGNDVQEQYCPKNITNYYAKFVHQYEGEGMGYAFAYDDTNPIAEGLTNGSRNAAGLIVDTDPASIFITVGL